MKIKKAIIAAAGFGTRLLPISKTIQKEMLPILNRPLIDYVVEDCVKAGIEEIIFVINEHNQQVKHFYKENLRLHQYLKKMNKEHLYEKVARYLHSQATFTFIDQPDAGRYGTAVPVDIAKQYVENEEAFLVFMGDDFIYHQDGVSEAAEMIKLFNDSGAQALITTVTKSEADISKYGVVKYRSDDKFKYLESLVEKPKKGQAPSNLANISKYIFTPQIFEIIDSQKVNPKSGELYITDSILNLAQMEPVVVHETSGQYLDGGSVWGLLEANLTVAQNDPELRERLRLFAQQNFC